MVQILSVCLRPQALTHALFGLILTPVSYLKDLDYSVLQQCIHCGMCLPTCPTYMETKVERNSPRGRIALMRSIADGCLDPTPAFGEEMYFCIGCLACETACPAGVDYGRLFEMARAEAERSHALPSPGRKLLRGLLLDFLFRHQSLLRLAGRLLWIYQATGLQALVRSSGLLNLFPQSLRDLEAKTPVIERHFSPDLIAPEENPGSRRPPGDGRTYRVGLLTGCIQDLVYSHINRDTADVLLANGCTVVTPPGQGCCGSLHAHNGEYELSKDFARSLIDQFDLDRLDAIITNSAGCGSHLKHFDRLLHDDPHYAAKARFWSEKVRDISEWLVEIDFRPPEKPLPSARVTYHDACHLCHGQKITAQPRQLLAQIPDLDIVPLAESTWCCGSAGIYNLIQPDMAGKLLERKIGHIAATGATTVATANPGCLLQIQNGLAARGLNIEVVHPVSLLARAYHR
ncbi:MAG: 4Fe-4S dicluster domain-containing protein [Methylacidiphilales bacterium]|nr:4Fe-4S dicluster domain-containing protein [Candidatus Methylacidiphilales bacterium]